MSYRAATTTRPAGRGDVHPATGHKTLRYTAALSFAAALIHLWAAPEHLHEWWGYGAFFLATVLGQGLYGAALLLHGLGRRRLLFLGSVGNLAIVVLYVITRTVGIPLLGPHAGEVEGVAPLGLAATASEIALVVTLGALALDRELLGARRGKVAVGLALVLASFAYGVLHYSHRDSSPDHHADHHAALEPESSGYSEPSEGRPFQDLRPVHRVPETRDLNLHEPMLEHPSYRACAGLYHSAADGYYEDGYGGTDVHFRLERSSIPPVVC